MSIANTVTRTTVNLLDSVVCKAEATVEAARTLTDPELNKLAAAFSKIGKAMLRVKSSAMFGTPSFTIDSISVSYDGTNFNVLETFGTAITVNADAEALRVLANPIISPLKIRLDISVSTLSTSHYITLLAEIHVAG